MQTRLSIEKYNVAIDDMPFHDVTNPQTIGNSSAVSKLQELLEAAASRSYIVSTWVDVTSVAYGLLEKIDVVSGHTFWICQYLGNTLWHSDLVNPQVGVGRNDSTAGEVDTFSRQVTSETTLLALQPLTEAAYWFLAHLRRHAWKFRVDVHSDGKLQEIPLFL